MKYFVYYLIAINIIGFLAMGIDKHKAKHNKYRIPEKTLFVLCGIGGSVGTILGMFVFSHKTRHLQFRIGMPLILIIQLLLLYYFLYR